MKDNCLNWIESGEIGEELSYAPNVKLHRMPRTDKYVLEFDSEVTGYDENWIEVENKFNETMELSITYMVNGPPPSKYPEVEAIRPGIDSYTLSTEAPTHSAGQTIHISTLAHLGEIPPLTRAHVQFKPQSKTEWNFRITQALVTPPKILKKYNGGVVAR